MSIKVTSPDKMSPTAVNLGFGRIKNANSRFKPTNKTVVINWGWENIPEHVKGVGKIINDPTRSKYSGNKLEFFKTFHRHRDSDYLYNTSVVPWTESKQDAEKWIDEGSKVVCRTVLRGFGGEGIVLATTKDQLVDCQLYTKYIPKRNEYRVHYIKGQKCFVQRKARNKDIPDDQVNWQIRNHDNGFVFAFNEGHEHPKQVEETAQRLIRGMGLEFGAVDIVWNERQGKAYVLEINVAPGLENTTLEFYKKGLGDLARGIDQFLDYE